MNATQPGPFDSRPSSRQDGALPSSAAASGTQQQQQSESDSPAFHNPYLGHRQLTKSEAHLLGEYYRLSQTLKRILAISGPLSATKPHAQVLDSLRLTERKMGLVITLFKASVWSIMMEQDEKERAREEARRMLEEEEEMEAQEFGDQDSRDFEQNQDEGRIYDR